MTAPTSINGPAVTLTLRVFRERYTKFRKPPALLARLQARGVLTTRSNPAYVRNVEGGWKKPSAEVLDVWLDEIGLPPGWVAVPDEWGDLVAEVTALRAAREQRAPGGDRQTLAA